MLTHESRSDFPVGAHLAYVCASRHSMWSVSSVLSRGRVSGWHRREMRPGKKHKRNVAICSKVHTRIISNLRYLANFSKALLQNIKHCSTTALLGDETLLAAD